jgi:oxygen-independent coproporphyrinogen-3 oxidase
VLRAYEWIRAEGFQEVNLDLLYGIPRQSLGSTQRDVQEVARLAPEHIDAHPWKPFDGCPLDAVETNYQEEKSKKVTAARWMCDYLETHGYENYNHRCFCRPGHENLMHLIEATYALPFLGFGAGCEQFRGPKTVVDIEEYIQADYAVTRFTPIQMPRQEFDLLQVIDGSMRELLLPEGIDLPWFNERYRCDLKEDLLEGKMQVGTPSVLDLHRAARLQLLKKMQQLYRQGIIVSDDTRLKLVKEYRVSSETWAFYMQAC